MLIFKSLFSFELIRIKLVFRAKYITRLDLKKFDTYGIKQHSFLSPIYNFAVLFPTVQSDCLSITQQTLEV